ncbi:MAG: Ger(x)C family spore germination protein [Acidobacteriota bacterium]
MKRAAWIVLMLLLTTGCWSRVEINDLALVVASGIDVVHQGGVRKVRYTMQIANPTVLLPGGGGGGGKAGGPKAFWTVAGMGKTLRDATMDASERIPKRIFFGQNRLFLIGEEAAREKVPFEDRIGRSRETRRNIWMAISKGEAKKVLEVEMPTFQATSLAINNMFEVQGGTQAIVPITAAEFEYVMSTGCCSPVAPVIEVVPQTSFTVEDKKPGGGGPDTLKVSGLAVFDHDGKLLDFMDEQHTYGYMWVRNKVTRREMTLPDPSDRNSNVTVAILNSSSTTKVNIGQDGTPEYEIRVSGVSDLLEHFAFDPGLSTSGSFSMFEAAINRQLEKEILMSVEQAKSMHGDIFEFGEELRRQHYPEWKRLKDNWSEVFPQVRVRVKSEITLRHRGLAVETPGVEEER